MALTWQWKDKCGEAVIRQTWNNETKDFTVNLYEGNAYLIFINEWEENGENLYSLYTFFADKEHMRNCLGLNKKMHYGDNMFVSGGQRLTKIRLNKKKCHNCKNIVEMLVQAFDNIEIEIFSDEEEEK